MIFLDKKYKQENRTERDKPRVDRSDGKRKRTKKGKEKYATDQPTHLVWLTIFYYFR